MATPNRPVSGNIGGQGVGRVLQHGGIFASTGPSPKKRVKLEEVPAATEEIAATRKLVLDEKLSQMLEVKESYFDNLTECFFLQNGGGMMDYYAWRKRPTPQLVHFLKSGRLDSDDEEDPVVYLKEGKAVEESKGTSGSSAAPSSSASTVLDGSELGNLPGIKFDEPFDSNLDSAFLPPLHDASKLLGNRPSGTSTLAVSSSLHRSVSDSRLPSLTAQAKTPVSVIGSGNKKPAVCSPGSVNNGTNFKAISTQEAIVERAKQEAQVMSRVAELRKEGLWSSRRLPKVQEPPRPKAHWDYLLEEMQWLAADFLQERKWKKTCARKIAKMVQKYFQDLEQKELRAEKEESMKLKKIASNMAKMVKEFWTNIEKVVQYKQNSRLDEKRKKAMDLHLNFIVNQTEQYSNWLSEGLAQSSKGSSVGSVTPDPSVAGDDEFKPEVESESDDEETIEKDEEGIDESETRDEVAALQKESELPIEQLIENLPKEILEKPAPLHADSDEEMDESKSKKGEDEEFEADDDDSDVEETIEEQEKHEEADYKDELNDLKDEGDMDIEALRAKYAAAYDPEFEMPQDSGEESTDINDSDDDDDEDEEEDEEEEESEEEEEEEEMDADNNDEDVGLEALMDSDKKETEEEGPGKELVNIAEQAASLQPKGYTLQTTEVKTVVPFLLKHTLREYQHVGLDWLATMYEKRLNGILADEMGLGKTIQTIALIAHLACEKGIWGPHLIVVPTSVMLNWEMEFKKWCPAFKILTYYGTQKERKQKRTGWTKTNAFHICITSYKLVIQDHNAFRRKKWKYLILDEAQNIKNFKSQRWQCLLNFNSMRRLLLTGTPLQNSLMELWSLMHFLMPHVFQSHKDFKEWFANPLTGMIEGSHEYNESLIRRLHKVLRPFLLRRLKDDVEKQMPKKYEHIVMCHLSKRQRFLYDEFMAQGKTKETLASGHFMSVINILMQLRKVCNHPSLFDPRPIVSPLQMEGIVYHTASLVLGVCGYDPLNDINLQRYPGLAEMERDLPAFIAHRVRKLQTPRRLIEEIEVQPSPPSRPPPGKLKTNMIRCVSPAIQSGRASPAVNSRSVSPAPVIKSISSLVTGSSQPPLQATVSPQVHGNGAVNAVSQPATSQPITVQIQQTGSGTRLVVPTSQLSQIPGFLQIVQTSSGPQAVATSSVVSTTSVVSGSPVVTLASSNIRTAVSTSVSEVKMSPGIQSGSSAGVQLPAGVSNAGLKPVMRVSPLADGLQNCTNSDGLVFTAACTSASTSFVTSASKPVATVSCTPQMIKHRENKKKKRSKSEFFLEPLYDKLQCKHQDKLNFISRTNKQHCERKPVYGQDLCEAVNIFKDPYSSRTYKNRDLSLWHGPGHIHCQCTKLCTNCDHPKYLWHQTSALSEILHTPEQYLHELESLLDRFVFVTPPVQSTPLRLHVSHPPPSYLRDEAYRETMLRTHLSPKTAHYHKICTKMTVQFPELRLIQYDCGKLQTLDILLHRLKSGDHRVLIFTQMTRMLDILEAFLNYHGHRYLRLDGTTKIEQRQQLMDRFNADRRIFCFILSTRSGGVGVNLTGADTVIFYDSDWNPTMDAQAQDRCHRIGQTRDVHIYRLVSERTVEENILKKANQKRMLGDMAIEGGNFTTAFFKENTINELFSEPSGLDSLVKEKEAEEKERQIKMERQEHKKKPDVKKQDPSETQALAQFEKALAKTEDETDAVAIDQVKAEQKAELAEFDESIPLDENGEPRDEESHVEQELAMLDKELTPIERYAVQFSELMMEPVNEEELKTAEEDIEAVKRDWELNRLKALKEEEEKRAELEEDEMLYTYSRDDAYQQVKKRNKQLAAEAKRAAIESQNLGLSPRRAGRQSLGGGDELDESPSKRQWVYKTPKIIRDLVKNKNTPVDTDSSKKKTKESKGEYDTTEDVDVETVDVLEESVKQKVKKKVEKVKRPRKPKIDNNVGNVTNISVQKESAPVVVSSSPEATKLDSLPGYSAVNDRENIFQKLQSPTKLVPDRTNIFEQFNMQPAQQVHGINVVQSPGQIFHTPVAGQTVRLINTPQGQKMVVVSSSPTSFQATSPQNVVNPQNVVLLQGMQGFPQGIVVGNSIVSLQGTPIQVAPVARAGNPVNIQGPRVVASPQLVQPARLGTRIVSPATGQSPAFVQRIVGTPQVNTGLLPATVSVPQLSPQSSNNPNPQLGGLAQLRLPTQLVHNSGGQVVNIQTPTAAPQKKSSVQTIANLIAANKLAKQQSPPQPRQSAPAQVPAMRPLSVPNLSNLMKAQVPHTVSAAVTSTQVRVNPTVAKLVASHIHSANAMGGPSGAGPSASVTPTANHAAITLSSAARSQSPTVVKVVSVSRTSSPVPKVTTHVQSNKIPTLVQGVPPRTENPVATINIKGLPPGVSIPASLVNSLVSGSIGISKGGLIKGIVPVGSTGNKTAVKKPAPDPADHQRVIQNATHSPKLIVTGDTNGKPSPIPTPVAESPVNKTKVGVKVTPVSASASPTLQAWSNPNLVIRTRRAAVQQNQQKTRSPQIGPSPTVPPPDAIPTVVVNSNGPSTVNHISSPNHVIEAPMFIATKLEQANPENSKDANGNGGVDVIEIS